MVFYKKRTVVPTLQMKTKSLASNQNSEELAEIKKNLEYIRTQLSPKAGLIAVSKTVGAERVRFAHCFAGQCDFGENKVQELLKKSEALSDLGEIRWHFLGHLQKNKIKSLLRVPGLVLVHSIDSIALAEKLNHYLKLDSIHLDILIQVNTSQEDNKYGCSPQELLHLIQEVALNMQHLHIQGLMTISKWRAKLEENKACFRILRELKEEIEKCKIPNTTMDILSMGMSSDYEIALSQGSTMLRIGQKIFGERKLG